MSRTGAYIMAATALDEILNKSFDYIVVGGGTSGLTIASRLSSDPFTSVIVLEAGKAHDEGDPKVACLGQLRLQFGDPEYDYAFKTIPQIYSNGKQYSWARGKGLGGTSAINLQCWILPPSHEVDAIEALGNPGWNWDEYSKYQERVNQQVKLSAPGDPHVLDDLYLETLAGMGLKENKNPYDGYTANPFLALHSIDSETWSRRHAANSYYFPVRDRPNLVVITEAIVSRVLFDRSGSGDLTAIGAEFIHQGQTYAARSDREVILSAGAIKTPQILELSGIGRRDVLEKINIEVKVELPGVGENVQEHTTVSPIYELVSDKSHETLCLLRSEPSRNIPNTMVDGIRLMSFFYAPLSVINPEAAATVIEKVENEVERLKKSGTLPPGLAEQYDIQIGRLRNPEIPDCQFILYPGSRSTLSPLEPNKEYFGIPAISNHAFSRGSIHAKSLDPTEDPEIDPHYFELDHDVEIFLQHLSFVRKIVAHEPLKSLVAKEVLPGLECTDDQLRDFIKDSLSTTWHTVGSCSMLPRDKNGVVNPELIVYGTKNLRIVDLSIVPLHLSTHTQSVAYTIGEKAYDIIRGL